MDDGGSFKFRVFFSYSRADRRLANWLYGYLDAYRTPRDLVGSQGSFGPVHARLHPIFRDSEDLSARGSVAEVLSAALQSSESLLVLCTPASAKSEWVNREVREFIATGRSNRITCIIADGATPADASRSIDDYVPDALRGLNPLAADLREASRPGAGPIGDGRILGRIKVVAGLLGVDLDRLRRREERRRRRLMAALSVAAGAFATVAIAAGYLGFDATQKGVALRRALVEVTTERDRTEKALARETVARADETKQRLRADSETEIARQQRDSAKLAQSEFLLAQSAQAAEAGNNDAALRLATEAALAAPALGPNLINRVSVHRHQDRLISAFPSGSRGRMASSINGLVAVDAPGGFSVFDSSLGVAVAAKDLTASVQAVHFVRNSSDLIVLDTAGKVTRWTGPTYERSAWSIEGFPTAVLIYGDADGQIALVDREATIVDIRDGRILQTIANPTCAGQPAGRGIFDAPCSVTGVAWLGSSLVIAGTGGFAGLYSPASKSFVWSDKVAPSGVTSPSFTHVAALPRLSSFTVGVPGQGVDYHLAAYRVSGATVTKGATFSDKVSDGVLGVAGILAELKPERFRDALAVATSDSVNVLKVTEAVRSPTFEKVKFDIPKCVEDVRTTALECSVVTQGYTPDDRFFVRVMRDGKVDVFDTWKGYRIATFRSATDALAANLSPSRMEVAVEGTDKLVRVYRLFDLAGDYKERQINAASIAWTPSGKLLHGWNGTITVAGNEHRVDFGGPAAVWGLLPLTEQLVVATVQPLARPNHSQTFLVDLRGATPPKLLADVTCPSVCGQNTVTRSGDLLKVWNWNGPAYSDRKLLNWRTGAVISEGRVQDGLDKTELGFNGGMIAEDFDKSFEVRKISGETLLKIDDPYAIRLAMHPTKPLLAVLALQSSSGSWRAGAIWDVTKRKSVCDLPVVSDSTSSTFSPGGRYLALTSRNIVRVVRPEDCVIVAELPPTSSYAKVAGWSADESTIVVGDLYAALVFELPSGKEVARFDGVDKDPKLSPNGRALAALSFNKLAVVDVEPTLEGEDLIAWAGLATSASRTSGAADAQADPCDRFGANVFDPDHVGIAHLWPSSVDALNACEGSVKRDPNNARWRAQLGQVLLSRAFSASGTERRKMIDRAWAETSKAAGQDYRFAVYMKAQMMMMPGQPFFDASGGLALMQRAGELGVANAWDSLGEYYLEGRQDSAGKPIVRKSATEADKWLQRARDAGFAYALARQAEADDRVLLKACKPDRLKETCQLLVRKSLLTWMQVLRRAEAEGWVAEDYRGWQAKAATLVRMLASHDGIAALSSPAPGPASAGASPR